MSRHLTRFHWALFWTCPAVSFCRWLLLSLHSHYSSSQGGGSRGCPRDQPRDCPRDWPSPSLGTWPDQLDCCLPTDGHPSPWIISTAVTILFDVCISENIRNITLDGCSIDHWCICEMAVSLDCEYLHSILLLGFKWYEWICLYTNNVAMILIHQRLQALCDTIVDRRSVANSIEWAALWSHYLHPCWLRPLKMLETPHTLCKLMFFISS